MCGQNGYNYIGVRSWGNGSLVFMLEFRGGFRVRGFGGVRGIEWDLIYFFLGFEYKKINNLIIWKLRIFSY